MTEWKESKIKDFAEVKGGKRLPKGKQLTSVPTKHPYIRIRDLGKSKYLELNPEIEFVDDETQLSIARYIVNAGDILISVVGTIGLIGIVGESLDKANQTENCDKIINCTGIEPEYLYYYLISPFGQEEIKRGTVGAVQPKLPLKNVLDINVKYPAIAEQRKIVEILKNVDEKISINERINNNLEQQAQAVYYKMFSEVNGEPVELSSMVYIGDSDTDIPCMKLVNINGGHSIGVYNSETKDKTKVFRMLDENRIKYFAPADYTEGSKLEHLVQQIIDRTITNEILEDVHFDCIAEKLDETRGQSEEELKKEELIDKLEDSSNFANTHSIIEQMLEIKEWSEDQKCKLFKIALENNQVTYILKDVDVKDFYRMICKNNNSEEAKRIKEIIYEKE